MRNNKLVDSDTITFKTDDQGEQIVEYGTGAVHTEWYQRKAGMIEEMGKLFFNLASANDEFVVPKNYLERSMYSGSAR